MNMDPLETVLLSPYIYVNHSIFLQPTSQIIGGVSVADFPWVRILTFVTVFATVSLFSFAYLFVIYLFLIQTSSRNWSYIHVMFDVLRRCFVYTWFLCLMRCCCFASLISNSQWLLDCKCDHATRVLILSFPPSPTPSNDNNNIPYMCKYIQMRPELNQLTQCSFSWWLHKVARNVPSHCSLSFYFQYW